MSDALKASISVDAFVNRGGVDIETLALDGHYDIVCTDSVGAVAWTDVIENTVVTVGKNALLDNALAGAAYTVTGPFVGLISGTPTTAAGDTMASHASWTEVGGTNAPAYTGNRQTAAWSAASAGSKTLSSGLAFAITSAGTVGGAFMLYGSGAVATKDNTSGTLFSAGAFSGGNKVVSSGDTITVSYTISV